MPFPYILPFILPNGDGAAANPIVLDHLKAALSRYAQFLRDDAGNVKPNIALLTATITTTQHQQLEQALQDLAFFHVLPNAYGQHLDNLGKIVGQPRAGLADDPFRTRVRARIKANQSSGTTEDLLAVVKLILPLHALTLTNYYPAAFVLTASSASVDALTAIALAGFVKISRSAGVGGQFEWSESAPNNTFMLDAGPGLDIGHLAGASGG